MISTINDLLSRRSIRSYTDEPVSQEELEVITKAGLYAPSGMGKQSAIMVVVQDPETVKKLEALNASAVGRDPQTSHNFYGAPVVIVVLADKSVPTYRYDGALVMGNLLNAAHAIGLGGCWIHRAKEMFETEEGKALLKQWGVQGEVEGIGNAILGHIAGEVPEPKPRREGRLFWVK
jgi:nitroreductase